MLNKYWEQFHQYLSNGFVVDDTNSGGGDQIDEKIPYAYKLLSRMRFTEELPAVKSVDEKWAEIKGDILRAEGRKYNKSDNSYIHQKPKGHKKNLFISGLRYAAMFLLVTGLPYLIYNSYSGSSSKQAVKKDRIVKVGNKERFSILLSDGTKVMLDAGSELRIPGDYNFKNRNVYLKGEAFFQVAHDKVHPFKVYANYALVSVVGTEFNVRAWDEIPSVVVTVKRGKVALSSASNEHSMKVFLTKNKQSVIRKDSNPSTPIDVNAGEYTSWMNNELNFKGATLREVLAQLERWYDYHFIVDDSLLYESHLTYHIKKTNIENFLQSISIITNTNVIKEGKKIKLVKKG